MREQRNTLGKRIAIIICDLYRFKQTNDMFGHQTGDKVLREAVRMLKSQMRQNDSLVRYGGDEFVIVLTECDEQQVVQAISRFHEAVRQVKYGPNNTISLDADFGYAYTEEYTRDSAMLSDMIRRADESMYRQKQSHNSELSE